AGAPGPMKLGDMGARGKAQRAPDAAPRPGHAALCPGHPDPPNAQHGTIPKSFQINPSTPRRRAPWTSARTPPAMNESPSITIAVWSRVVLRIVGRPPGPPRPGRGDGLGHIPGVRPNDPVGRPAGAGPGRVLCQREDGGDMPDVAGGRGAPVGVPPG